MEEKSVANGIGRAVFGALTPAQQSAVFSVGRLRRYADKQMIAQCGATDHYLSIIEAGAVRLSRVGRDGQLAVTATLQPGDSFGEFTVFAHAPRQFDFHAIGDTRIREIPREVLLKLLSQSPDVMGKLIEVLARKLLSATQALEAVRSLPLIPRTARLLLALTDGQNPSARWEGTQTELADTLGLTRVSVSHALRELRRQGLIRTAYRRIEIPDVNALQEWLDRSSPL